ncbi:hypothetical protein AB1Y20_017469 [Prymnesium parvum]|uniref:Uncharacterized protein n=1 Tax=Prymnesium parvum TaxID=97485 RepID=A0AB34JP91_PRYPA
MHLPSSSSRGLLRHALAPRLLSSWQLSSRLASGASNEPWPAADRLNRTLEEYPLSAATLHMGMSLGTFGVVYGALSCLHFDAPALAVGGIVSKLTKKLRTPVDLSLAATLSHAVPSTNALRLGPLLGVAGAAPPPSGRADGTGVESSFAKLAQWAEGPVNQYGGPFMMVHWASGLTIVGATTYCVHHGVDVMALVQRLPFMADSTVSASASETASCVAGAMVMNTLSLPFRLYLMSLYAHPALVALDVRYRDFLRDYRSRLKAHLRSSPDAPRRLLRRRE